MGVKLYLLPSKEATKIVYLLFISPTYSHWAAHVTHLELITLIILVTSTDYEATVTVMTGDEYRLWSYGHRSDWWRVQIMKLRSP
jgi:hypothetical protein